MIIVMGCSQILKFDVILIFFSFYLNIMVIRRLGIITKI